MKSLVAYYSKTGNTEKIAKAIAKGLGADLRKIEGINNVSEYDLICVGTPVYGFAPANPVKEFLEKIPPLPNRKGAAFCTMHAFGDKRTLRIIKEKMENEEVVFLGGFSCRGLSRIFANFGPKIFNKGKPNEDDLKRAEGFGKRLLTEAEKSETYGKS